MRLILAAALFMSLTGNALAQCHEPPPAPKTSAIPAEPISQPG